MTHCRGFTGRFTVYSHWTFTTGSWWFSTWCSHYEEASTPAKLLTAREREEPVAWPTSHKRHSHSLLIGPCKLHVNNCMKNNCIEQYKPQVQKVSKLSLTNNTESHCKHCTQTSTLWLGLQDENMLTSLALQGFGVQFPLRTNIKPKSGLLTCH